jgi:hypothetical protein
MVPADSTLSGCPLEANQTCRPEIDPIAHAVRVGLLIYLAPVLLLVAIIGVTGIAAGQVARLTRKIVGFARNHRGAIEGRDAAVPLAAIGVRPILAIRRNRSRVIR